MGKGPKKEGPTPEETALKETSVAQWNDYVARFRPAEAALIRKAELTSGERASVKGQASADAAAAFKGLSKSTIASNAASGANVASGRTKFSLAADAEAQGRARGLGAAAAETGAEIDEAQQGVRITAIGRQLGSDATADLARGARRATNLALAASQAKFERNQARVNAAFAIAGASVAKGMELHKGRKKRLADEARAAQVAIPDFDFGSTDLGMPTMRNFTPTLFEG